MIGSSIWSRLQNQVRNRSATDPSGDTETPLVAGSNESIHRFDSCPLLLQILSHSKTRTTNPPADLRANRPADMSHRSQGRRIPERHCQSTNSDVRIMLTHRAKSRSATPGSLNYTPAIHGINIFLIHSLCFRLRT
jgi:hypothetical protein